MLSRREFLPAGAALAGGLMAAPAANEKDRISLAAWSLTRSFFVAHRWKNLELPRICREQFGITALEFVNQFFENPVIRYLDQLNRAGKDNGVTFVRIMVDGEGDMAAIDRKQRMAAAVAHRKWVDVAHYLGCMDIRCNMRGGLPEWKKDQDIVKRTAESFHDLLEYSKGSGLNIVIENHGGASSDPDVLVGVMKAVNSPRLGTLPDFGNVNEGDDRAQVLRKIIPYAKGVSVKAAWADEKDPGWNLEELIGICQEVGFHGYWGIESSFGRGARPVRGQPRPTETTSPEQLWENEVKGVRFTKAVLERTVFKNG